MGKTLAEKIVGERAGKAVVAGENAIVNVDWTFTHDASGPLVLMQLKDLGMKPKRPDHTIIFIDHAVPSPRQETSNVQMSLREFAWDNNLIFSEAGNGICHQVIVEDYASPGEIVIGTDSHSCMAGALGAFATGMGATDAAVAMALGKTWLRVPEAIQINVSGRLRKGVYSKDLILHVIGKLGADGATYKSMEWAGSAVKNMAMFERLTLSNMAIEAGGKVGLMFTDGETERYLKARDRGDRFKVIEPDSDANYESVLDVDGSSLVPTVSIPHAVDTVKTVDELENVRVDIVFIGSCTNTRLEDLQVAADILKGKKVDSKTRLIVTPASRKVAIQATLDGTFATLMEAGAVITPSGCGMCFGALGGVPGDGEVVFSTSNRNFPGRMGNPKAFTYLGSPAAAAATALTGYITDPRKYV